MGRKNQKRTIRPREFELVEEFSTFAQFMESRHIKHSRTTAYGRKVWTVHPSSGLN